MDSFEILIGKLLEVEGYWLTYNYRVNLSPEDKRQLDNYSMPRPEIDILAFKPSLNELLIFECKSYLDSTGVCRDHVESRDRSNGRKSIRLFSDDKFRALLIKKLVVQMKAQGLLEKNPEAKVGLVCGKVKSSDREHLQALFNRRGWLLWTPEMVAKKVRDLSSRAHENNLATYIVKILAAAAGDAV